MEKPYSFDHNVDRVSQFIDEWHVRDEITLDKIVGIAIPFKMIRESKYSLELILKILEYAKLYGWQVYDADMDLIENVNKENLIFGSQRLQKTAKG